MRSTGMPRAHVVKKGTKVSDIPVLVGVPETDAEGRIGPTARVLRGEGGETRIEVLCPCGSKIVLECEFETTDFRTTDSRCDHAEEKP